MAQSELVQTIYLEEDIAAPLLITCEQIAVVKEMVTQGVAIPAIIVGSLIDRLERAEGRSFVCSNRSAVTL